MATKTAKNDVSAMPDLFIKMMIYGIPGVGKTTLLASGVDDPRLHPGLLLDFEGGVLAIRSKIRPVTVEQIQEGIEPEAGKLDVVPIREWDDLQAVYDAVFDNPGQYKMFAIDSLSEVNYLCLQDIVKAEAAKNPRRDTDSTELHDYMVNANRMRRLIRGFRDLPAHLIITCAAQDGEDPRTHHKQHQPSLTGKLTFELPGLMDAVAYMVIEGVEDSEEPIRVLYVDPGPGYIAKDRSEGGMLGGEIEEPTLPGILDLLKI
jgi:hypothetical protein